MAAAGGEIDLSNLTKTDIKLGLSMHNYVIIPNTVKSRLQRHAVLFRKMGIRVGNIFSNTRHPEKHAMTYYSKI
jgi:hypothetical protein